MDLSYTPNIGRLVSNKHAGMMLSRVMRCSTALSAQMRCRWMQRLT